MEWREEKVKKWPTTKQNNARGGALSMELVYISFLWKYYKCLTSSNMI
jgi:hypothetical protein